MEIHKAKNMHVFLSGRTNLRHSNVGIFLMEQKSTNKFAVTLPRQNFYSPGFSYSQVFIQS